MSLQGAEEFVVEDVGRMSYVDAAALQREVHGRVVDGTGPQTLLLVEHDPVVTVSRRRDAARHVLVGAERLAELGVDIQDTDRGGDVTYHGPGQLVAYPILRLGGLGLNVGRYMRLLEAVVIDAVGVLGVKAWRRDGLTGVWAGACGVDGGAGDGAKLCALGVRVRRGVAMHGLALNVCPEMAHFELIVPCGLAGCGVTSLAKILGDRVPAMEQVKEALVGSMRSQLHASACVLTASHIYK